MAATRPSASTPKRPPESRSGHPCGRFAEAPRSSFADFRGFRRKKEASRPVSRVPSSTVIHLRRPLPGTFSDYPKTRAGDPFGTLSLRFPICLSSGGVCPASSIALGAVVSYTTFSPLPKRGAPAVFFLLHFPLSRDTWPLASALPCEARTFLPRAEGPRATVKPAR